MDISSHAMYKFTLESEDGVREYAGTYIPPWDASDYALRLSNQISHNLTPDLLTEFDLEIAAVFFLKNIMSFDRKELQAIVEYLLKSTVINARGNDITSEALQIKSKIEVDQFFARYPQDYFPFLAHIIYHNLSPFLPAKSIFSKIKKQMKSLTQKDDPKEQCQKTTESQ